MNAQVGGALGGEITVKARRARERLERLGRALPGLHLEVNKVR